MDPLDKIINDIKKEANDSGVTLAPLSVPKPKLEELSEQQKIILAEYIAEVGLQNITAITLSKKLNITVEKAKNYIKNSNRLGRTNNLKTIGILQEEVSSMEAKSMTW
ncbi:hypothetical protein DDB_G0289165 [Dictyostelium discoideum AX4]|uniref:MatA protein n=1 Tax=Dictyostelium discoideum TaxID=44689 RepID=Q54HW9_DICDI|nr:hypothetical protein DDB_G0289165 [Dictyostelium discoideum AX4]EAL62861.1 hypothetical protein DDB_G0289165 [Dictyostelium discoideum AX4]CBA34802.1 MatA protein [Dictyostelium discoideum]|eukprot:XP_636365.1 hypothetical protein DDB_G0289165 [Dictyostelium discoideum AX4]